MGEHEWPNRGIAGQHHHDAREPRARLKQRGKTSPEQALLLFLAVCGRKFSHHQSDTAGIALQISHHRLGTQSGMDLATVEKVATGNRCREQTEK